MKTCHECHFNEGYFKGFEKVCSACIIEGRGRCGEDNWHWCPKGVVFIWDEVGE